MDIYAKPGTKVRYTGEGGYDNDKHFANSHFKVGDVLTVKNIKVGNFMSYAEFEEHPGRNFNTVMFEEVTNNEEDKNQSLIDSLSEFSEKMQESAEQYERECEEYWKGLSYDDQLKAFYSVCKRIYKADVEIEGSYRYALYDVFQFGPDAYLVGMESGYMDIHNYIQEGKAAHRNENDLPKDL